ATNSADGGWEASRERRLQRPAVEPRALRRDAGTISQRSPLKESQLTRPRPINSVRPASTKTSGSFVARASSGKNIAPRRVKASKPSRAVPVGSREGVSLAREAQESRSSRINKQIGVRRIAVRPAPQSLPHATSPERVNESSHSRRYPRTRAGGMLASQAPAA